MAVLLAGEPVGFPTDANRHRLKDAAPIADLVLAAVTQQDFPVLATRSFGQNKLSARPVEVPGMHVPKRARTRAIAHLARQHLSARL